MNKAINFLLNFFKPVVVIFSSIGGIISLILGAIADPTGAVNQFLVTMIDNIAEFFPSTPDEYKVFNILNSIGDSLPLVGKAVVY